jgi:hypothetical protein
MLTSPHHHTNATTATTHPPPPTLPPTTAFIIIIIITTTITTTTTVFITTTAFQFQTLVQSLQADHTTTSSSPGRGLVPRIAKHQNDLEKLLELLRVDIRKLCDLTPSSKVGQSYPNVVLIHHLHSMVTTQRT